MVVASPDTMVGLTLLNSKLNLCKVTRVIAVERYKLQSVNASNLICYTRYWCCIGIYAVVDVFRLNMGRPGFYVYRKPLSGGTIIGQIIKWRQTRALGDRGISAYKEAVRGGNIPKKDTLLDYIRLHPFYTVDQITLRYLRARVLHLWVVPVAVFWRQQVGASWRVAHHPILSSSHSSYYCMKKKADSNRISWCDGGRCLDDGVLPRRHRDAESSRFPTRFTFFLFSTDSFLLKDTHVRLFVKSRRFDIYRLHNTSHKFLFFYQGNKTPGRAAISVTLKGRPASTFRHRN
jgi:hypothetical protein